LREKAKDVQNIDKKFIEQMVATMDAYSGIGLAAPQVNRSERIFVTRAPVENSQGEYEKGELKIFINPVPLNFSEETVEFSEGCLSIPGVRSQVIRPKELTMEYTDIEGARKKESFSGWTSRVIQHEYDHIEGILFIDRLS
jgi:peptide deformylase